MFLHALILTISSSIDSLGIGITYGIRNTTISFIARIILFAIAFIVSIISIKFLLRYVRTNDFKAFGWYRIILGLIVFAYFYFQG